MKDEPMASVPAARASDRFVRWAFNIALLVGFVAAFYALFDALSG